MKIPTWWRDWRRGYSDADIASAAEKMSVPLRPGQWVWVSDREFKAIRDNEREVFVSQYDGWSDWRKSAPISTAVKAYYPMDFVNDPKRT